MHLVPDTYPNRPVNDPMAKLDDLSNGQKAYPVGYRSSDKAAIEANGWTTIVAPVHGKSRGQATSCACAANCDPLWVNVQPLRVITDPVQRRITVIQYRRCSVFLCKTILYQNHNTIGALVKQEPAPHISRLPHDVASSIKPQKTRGRRMGLRQAEHVQIQ